ncbi:MAG: hypothetical protein GY869_03495, partial [Planctomycetes bacterium]|nr:hypothetical protein [Planctomycetota bacterium]
QIGAPAQLPAPSDKPNDPNTTESDEVGATPGSFRVNEAGAATYSIPIVAAPGVAGVAPQISLNYSSQGGNGLVGRGWSIGGLSAISRCRKTKAIDGIAKPIDWDDEEGPYCLDGQRLIYDDAEDFYRTEIDSFVKVKKVVEGESVYFEVTRKDGSTSEYGKTSDSQLQTSQSKTFVWAISQFSDNMKNPIRFTYQDDAETIGAG